MTYIRKVALAAVVAASAATGVALMTDKAEARFRWGGIELQEVMPSSLVARIRWGSLQDVIQAVMPTSTEARRRFAR